jgi:hypothetical protein
MSGTLEPVQPPKNEPPPDPTWRGVEFSSTLFLLCPLPGPKSSRLSRQDSSPSPKNYVLRPRTLGGAFVPHVSLTLFPSQQPSPAPNWVQHAPRSTSHGWRAKGGPLGSSIQPGPW